MAACDTYLMVWRSDVTIDLSHESFAMMSVVCGVHAYGYGNGICGSEGSVVVVVVGRTRLWTGYPHSDISVSYFCTLEHNQLTFFAPIYSSTITSTNALVLSCLRWSAGSSLGQVLSKLGLRSLSLP